LQLTPNLGRVGLISLINHFETAENALEAAKNGWPKLPGLRQGLANMVPESNSETVRQASQSLNKMKGWIITLWDTEYPQHLRQIPDPPALLYGCGVLPDEPCLAIVGARYPTAVGRIFTEQIAAQVAEAGIVISSGLARGIDTAAHRGALNGAGKTVAVLGCGLDHVYPPENKSLYEKIIDQGALLSEYAPGTEPLPGHFPGRNRIISGLSKATLVVEAACNSGSLITAEFALEQGRDVMAVPGGIDRKTSYGPNLLIKQGAHPVTEASEVLEILGMTGTGRDSACNRQKTDYKLSEPAGRVLSKLDLNPRHSDELAGESGLTPMELSAILLQLELQDYAEKLPGGRYIRGRQAR
jgi:DNA processing protein